MEKRLTSADLAGRIKELREKQRWSMADVGRWFDVPRQTVHQAENPARSGQKIDELRVKILARLLEEENGEGISIEGPVFVVTTPSEPTLFDEVKKPNNKAA